LWVGRFTEGTHAIVPDAPFVHVFVARGVVDVEGAGVLQPGDALRATGAGARRVEAIADAELVVWETWADIAFA